MKKGKKFLSLLMVLSLGTSMLVGCGSSQTKSAGQTKSASKKVIKIGIGYNEQSPQYIGLQKFKELVEKETQDFDIQLFANSQLGDDTKMTQALRMGTQEMTMPSTAPLSGIDKKWMAFDLPFLFPSAEVADKVVDGPVGQKFLDSLQKYGLVGIAWWENGYRDLTNNKREVKTPADMKGLKIRTMENPVHLASFRAMGANPTPMPFGELFTAMQQKTIDGQENPISTIALQKFNEVQKYCTISQHFYSPFVFLMSKKTWDTLTKDQQAIIVKAGKEAGVYERKLNRDSEDKNIQSLEKAGMKVTKLTPEEHQAFVDATKDVGTQFVNDIGKDTLDEMMAEIAKQSK